MTECLKEISLCVGQHNDKPFLFTVRDQDGALVDISDAAQITFIVAESVSGQIYLTKTIGSGVTINNANQFTVTLTDTETGTLPPGVLYCEVELTDSGGGRYTIGAGEFAVQDTRIRGV